ncbi:hypothetical protein DSO57_1020020 [Entomophthora muscae]|uniref:Uncharacterized protein n=1 Tax=Entomophthora muscae TaxID=34485 RepID=A0ACC2UQH3_9FUNG|nr:hypothetical protein DSO57_1020020 [Entomophthora muscae]
MLTGPSKSPLAEELLSALQKIQSFPKKFFSKAIGTSKRLADYCHILPPDIPIGFFVFLNTKNIPIPQVVPVPEYQQQTHSSLTLIDGST